MHGCIRAFISFNVSMHSCNNFCQWSLKRLNRGLSAGLFITACETRLSLSQCEQARKELNPYSLSSDTFLATCIPANRIHEKTTWAAADWECMNVHRRSEYKNYAQTHLFPQMRRGCRRSAARWFFCACILIPTLCRCQRFVPDLIAYGNQVSRKLFNVFIRPRLAQCVSTLGIAIERPSSSLHWTRRFTHELPTNLENHPRTWGLVKRKRWVYALPYYWLPVGLP